MNTHLEHAFISLSAGKLLRIKPCQGRAVAVARGLVWLTQDHDPRDVILGDGESFELDRPGLAIVQALHNSSVLVLEPGPRPVATARHEVSVLAGRS